MGRSKHSVRCVYVRRSGAKTFSQQTHAHTMHDGMTCVPKVPSAVVGADAWSGMVQRHGQGMGVHERVDPHGSLGATKVKCVEELTGCFPSNLLHVCLDTHMGNDTRERERERESRREWEGGVTYGGRGFRVPRPSTRRRPQTRCPCREVPHGTCTGTMLSLSNAHAQALRFPLATWSLR